MLHFYKNNILLKYILINFNKFFIHLRNKILKIIKILGY